MAVRIGTAVAATVLLVLAATMAGVYCGGSGGHNRCGGGGRSTTKRSKDDISAILSFVNKITLSNQTLRYPSNETAEERALLWLIDEDLERTTLSSSNNVVLHQRYAMATLWFMRSSTVTMPCGDDDDRVVATWINQNISECDWHGVNCSTVGDGDSDLADVDDTGGNGGVGVVTDLDLSSDFFQGRIPDDLGLLTDMTFLNLGSNRLKGTIPTSLGRLTALQYLDMAFSLLEIINNNVTCDAGEDDDDYVEWLRDHLRGRIPSLGNLTALTFLDLSGNELTGTIPTSSLGNFTNLMHLDLSDNVLSGMIPTSFLGNLTNLMHLDLSDNSLSGTIPSSLGLLTDLTFLSLSLSQLNGSIPSSLGKLTALTYLDLSHNYLSGTIPSSLERLTNLTALYLYNNELNSAIPFCNSTDNNKTGWSFDELVVDCDKVTCPCCTECCPTRRNGIPAYALC
jgi:Leucine-rich repeat (LRR) protein